MTLKTWEFMQVALVDNNEVISLDIKNCRDLNIFLLKISISILTFEFFNRIKMSLS